MKIQNFVAKEKIFLALAYIFGVVATLCCLPALLFLLFGFSFGFLGVEFLSAYRLPLSVVALGFFGAYLWNFQRCKKNLCQSKVKAAIFQISCALLLVFVLFYPEILGVFYA